MPIPSFLDRAGRWFLYSGIQEPSGGVARFYRADVGQNRAVSTEITGYAAGAFTYLHALTGESVYLERAHAAARFLTRTAWDQALGAIPFECPRNGAQRYAYFFDCGIIVRGLLSAWRATAEGEYLQCAEAIGRSMIRDYADRCEFHPILTLPDKRPIERDARWSRSPGCYQLKSAMAWRDLHEITGDATFAVAYNRVLETALASCAQFLPGSADPEKVMDRLHAFCYFLEGLLPVARDPQVARVVRDGLVQVSTCLREIAPTFARSDVYAQLLRARIYADWAGIAALDRRAAAEEAAALAAYQLESADPRLQGGFSFGRKGRELTPHVNPVSTSFAMQALALWQQHQAGGEPVSRHVLI